MEEGALFMEPEVLDGREEGVVLRPLRSEPAVEMEGFEGPP